MVASNATPAHMIIAWSEKAMPSRRWATVQPMNADNRMASPPIVAVPCFFMGCTGPWSSAPRIGWPLPSESKKVIMRGVPKREKSIETAPAMSTAIMLVSPSVSRDVNAQHPHH